MTRLRNRILKRRKGYDLCLAHLGNPCTPIPTHTPPPVHSEFLYVP